MYTHTQRGGERKCTECDQLKGKSNTVEKYPQRTQMETNGWIPKLDGFKLVLNRVIFPLLSSEYPEASPRWTGLPDAPPPLWLTLPQVLQASVEILEISGH